MIEFKNISKRFSGVEVLHDVSFSINAGSITAIMGENGAGKSTLMKILAGVIADYEGKVLWNGGEVRFHNTKDAESAGIAMIHQELNLVPDLTIGENIFLGKEPVKKMGFINFRELHSRAAAILKEFDFPHSTYQWVKNIGLGWQQIVEIAKALHINSEIIIMDEPTSALTESEKEILFSKIKWLTSIGKTIIYVSHKMSEIFEIADEVVIMRDGKYISQSPVSTITREEIVEMMIGKKLSQDRIASKQFSNEAMLVLKGVNIFCRSQHKMKDISFRVNKGEVVGIAGLLGAGRTTLVKFLYGALEKSSYSGEVFFNGKEYFPRSITQAKQNKIMYLSEDRKTEGLFPQLDIGSNTSASILKKISRAGFVKKVKEVSFSVSMLRKLNTKYNSLHQLVTRLSGGNQQKVLLSRILLTDPKFILLDEPTRGIDVGAKEEIYSLIQTLSSQGITFLISSSEIPELERLCNKVLVLSSGYQTAFLEMGKTNSSEILKWAFEKV